LKKNYILNEFETLFENRKGITFKKIVFPPKKGVTYCMFVPNPDQLI
jgi:hypothetical protein